MTFSDNQLFTLRPDRHNHLSQIGIMRFVLPTEIANMRVTKKRENHVRTTCESTDVDRKDDADRLRCVGWISWRSNRRRTRWMFSGDRRQKTWSASTTTSSCLRRTPAPSRACTKANYDSIGSSVCARMQNIFSASKRYTMMDLSSGANPKPNARDVPHKRTHSSESAADIGSLFY